MTKMLYREMFFVITLLAAIGLTFGKAVPKSKSDPNPEPDPNPDPYVAPTGYSFSSAQLINDNYYNRNRGYYFPYQWPPAAYDYQTYPTTSSWWTNNYAPTATTGYVPPTGYVPSTGYVPPTGYVPQTGYAPVTYFPYGNRYNNLLSKMWYGNSLMYYDN